MLRKAKGIGCVILWCSQVACWLFIFDTSPLFNQLTNKTIILILALTLAILSSISLRDFLEKDLERSNGLVILWCSQVVCWLFIFDTCSLFNQLTNKTIILILALILAIPNSIGIRDYLKKDLERNR
ncbi:MAG: hypothetical protein HFJ55_00390 [Clostridia bacterium]|nr:hypothetical protein [Clostridia bacterium]